MKLRLLIFCVIAAALNAFGAEREVTVVNESAGISLGGTLSTPEGRPCGVIVMATGSGAQNRDEEIFGFKPFKVLSDALTEAGFAVLRTDDRGVGASEGDLTQSSLEDLCTDIAAQMEMLGQEFPGIPKGVLGHSQGGTLAIKTAARGGCDFIITLGAPAWTGDSIVMAQSRALAMAAVGRWDAEAQQRKLLDIAKGPLPAPMAQAMLLGAMSDFYGDAAKLPQVRERLQLEAGQMTSPSYRELLRYDPEADIETIGVPWLALNGAKDFQVPPANLTTIKEHNPQAQTIELEGHNHLFQECRTGMLDEYSRLGASPSDATVAVILQWLASESAFGGKR